MPRYSARAARRAISRFESFLHTITGQYGFSRSLFQRILQSAFNTTSAPSKALTGPVPHIYTVVVDGRWTGRRVGSTLIHLAKNAVQGSYGQISLHVDVKNNDAIRLYKRIGFRIVGDNADQYLMIWDLSRPQARENHNEPSGCFQRD